MKGQGAVNNRVGLVINWAFHEQRRWVSALTPYLVDELVSAFSPVIVQNQEDYDACKKQLRCLISLEPGWAAPLLRYDFSVDTVKAVFYSDPHFNTEQRKKYFFDNGFDFVFSYFKSSFFYHFKDFPEEQFVHLPWAIPDRFVSDWPLVEPKGDVAIFGGRQSPAYDVRNWCREQPGVTSYEYSGVENKRLTDEKYFRWLSGLEAAIAAGSSDPKYDLVTPKYFEIASSGALLIGQDCNDLDALGFGEENMLVIEKNNFREKLSHYQANPSAYLERRRRGRELIRRRHLVSHRIARIREVLGFVAATH